MPWTALPMFQLPAWLSLNGFVRWTSLPDTSESEADDEATRSRQQFILEMLDRHPESFANDHSMSSMLSLYRDRF